MTAAFNNLNWNLAAKTGEIATKGALVTMKYAARTTQIITTIASPLIGAGLGIYESVQLNLNGHSATNLVLAYAATLPLVCSAVNYGLARLEIGFQTSMRRNKTRNSYEIADLERNLKNSDFQELTVWGGPMMSGMVLGAITSAAITVPFNDAALYYFGALIGSFIGTTAPLIALGKPIEKHFHEVITKNLKRLPNYPPEDRFLSYRRALAECSPY